MRKGKWLEIEKGENVFPSVHCWEDDDIPFLLFGLTVTEGIHSLHLFDAYLKKLHVQSFDNKKPSWSLTKQIHMVIEYTRCRVKIKSKLTNLKINSRIEGYNGK